MLMGNSSKGGGTKWKLPHGSGCDEISECPECCALFTLQVEPINMDLDIRHASSPFGSNNTIITDTRRLFLQK
jgi:hypothetical protein